MWETIAGYELCSEPGGSPINFNTFFDDYEQYAVGDDNGSAQFANQRNKAITYSDYTTKVELDGVNQFKSDIGKNVLKFNPESWTATHFEFHRRAEHTIQGKRHDLEFQTVFSDPAGGE